ncbi:MAG: aminomethyl-transferring glycine dehydrogenase [Chitinophagales bacterium]|nr:aminomethyl-transferring glycine dehydrogenase [Chitinophagales bacterium]
MANPHAFQPRHIGTTAEETKHMLQTIGVDAIEQLIEKTIPNSIRLQNDLAISEALDEPSYLQHIEAIANKNKVFKNFIGQGYYGTLTPTVILRNIFENPGWYTQYTPYQAEIAQGRLEALLNFQTMIADLTGLPVANASLLDEATAVAEAMHLLYEVRNKNKQLPSANKIFIDKQCFAQTIEVVKGRAIPLDIELVVDDVVNFDSTHEYFALVIQYPSANGNIEHYESIIQKAKSFDINTVMACDIMSLALLKSPAELGATIAVGNTQRFGVPMGFGGPHAAFFACVEDFVRLLPGRLIGISKDKLGNQALRMALQTREQHIKRDKATSNICTAQALLAIMASMYAVYHGADGIKQIATEIHQKANTLTNALAQLNIKQNNTIYFDNINFNIDNIDALKQLAEKHQCNFWYNNNQVQIAIDETTSYDDIQLIVNIIAKHIQQNPPQITVDNNINIPNDYLRTDDILKHQVFNSYHSEHEMLRYIKRLEAKDLSLCHAMIPLGSCTMKLNATTQMIPVSWKAFANMHPFAPSSQTQGYQTIIQELEQFLANITGFYATSLQPNSGAQGEYAGLMVIRAFHENNGDTHRNIALIPSSAHGTNPASAAMAGMKIIIVKCDENGNIDVADLKQKAATNAANLSCLMVTYPSTHGVFEESIQEICDIIHQNGGKVYMDGANMNAQVGLTSPANIGADVCHLNLHKTFAIPHGGGGPGMGPICVTEALAPFLPSNPFVATGGKQAIPAIAAAPFGSASILLISYAYIKLLGQQGVKTATQYAILNANYMKARLEKHYDILFKGKNNTVAHEFIIDLRPFKAKTGIDAIDVAKRLIDYGFHAPTVAFPVAGTLMIEPTESESLVELDRFCEAMIAIKQEIDAIENGTYTKEDNPVINAPHILQEIVGDEWTHAYSRKVASYPLPYLQDHKFWASVAKIDNTYGDRNLMCTCTPIEDYV